MWILKKNANVLSFCTRALLQLSHSPAFIPQYPESSPISVLCPPPPLCSKISIWQNTNGRSSAAMAKALQITQCALSCKEQSVSDCKQHVCCCNCDCCDCKQHACLSVFSKAYSSQWCAASTFLSLANTCKCVARWLLSAILQPCIVNMEKSPTPFFPDKLCPLARWTVTRNIMVVPVAVSQTCDVLTAQVFSSSALIFQVKYKPSNWATAHCDRTTK